MNAHKSKSTPRELRRFATTVAIGLTLVGALSWWRGHVTVPVAFGSVAAVLLLLGVLAPAVLSPVERAWLTLGALLGWINTRLILTLVFYLIVTPVGAIVRLFRDPLDRRLHEPKPSYWIRRAATPFDSKTYEQQF